MAKTGGNSGRFAKGADPRRGVGVKGRSGRKPIRFRAECRELVDTDVLEACRQKLKSRKVDDPAWRWAAEYVSRYSKSEAPKRRELTGAKGRDLFAAMSRDEKVDAIMKLVEVDEDGRETEVFVS